MINFYDDTAIHKEINNNEEIKFITLNPNLEIDEVNDKFNNILANEMDKYCNHVINEPSNKQQMINDMYFQLTNAIKFAYSSCSRIITLKSLKKTKWFTTELKEIKKKLLSIQFMNTHTQDNLIELKILKKEFKKVMKKNIYLYEKNEYFKIEKLIKCNNGESFFKKVNLFKTKNKDNISIEIDTLANHYYNIFNKPLNVNKQTENEVNDEIKDIIHENFNSIEIYHSELCAVINQCQSSNVCGNDGLSSKMIKN
jgi:hypothetical protein